MPPCHGDRRRFRDAGGKLQHNFVRHVTPFAGGGNSGTTITANRLIGGARPAASTGWSGHSRRHATSAHRCAGRNAYDHGMDRLARMHGPARIALIGVPKVTAVGNLAPAPFALTENAAPAGIVEARGGRRADHALVIKSVAAEAMRSPKTAAKSSAKAHRVGFIGSRQCHQYRRERHRRRHMTLSRKMENCRKAVLGWAHGGLQNSRRELRSRRRDDHPLPHRSPHMRQLAAGYPGRAYSWVAMNSTSLDSACMR